MTREADDVYTACPQCESEIPFYRTVDVLKRCPECGTNSDVLFEIAMKETQTTPIATVEGGAGGDG